MRESLAKIALFQSLSPQQIDTLLSISLIEKFEEESILYFEKERSTRLLFLVDGLAKAYKIDKYDNEIILFFIESGGLVSQISDLQKDSMTFYSNISILEPSTILSIDYKSFRTHFLQTNLLTLPFANEVLLHSNKMQLLIDREFIYNAVSKVAMMIAEDIDMFNKLKRHDIALILHIQPATLSRVLMKLKQNDIIEIEHGKVSIIDENKLKAVYQE